MASDWPKMMLLKVKAENTTILKGPLLSGTIWTQGRQAMGPHEAASYFSSEIVFIYLITYVIKRITMCKKKMQF